MEILDRFWKKHPLYSVLILGLILRLCSAFFAEGYLMHDDHFLVVEAAGSWANGTDYNHWLPETPGNNGPEGHSLFYPGIHYGIFKGLMSMGIESPSHQMLIVRILHAFYSLLAILLVYRITLMLSNQKTARLSGLLFAVLFFLPNFSVRNLIEMVCIPPLLGSIYCLYKEKAIAHWKWFFWAGILAGIAVGVRYQSVLIVGGLGLVLLLERKWRGLIVFTLISIVAFFLTQIQDLFIWDEAFAELRAYIEYNLSHGSSYLQSPWYTYLLTILGVLIPPVSLFLVFGFVRDWRRLLLLTLPATIFLIVHMIIINKQERFILPILPLILIAGLVGWQRWVSQSRFWAVRKGFYNTLWSFFWLLNFAALGLFTFSFGKKARVQAMEYVYDQGAKPFMIEYSFRDEIRYPPQFYSGYWGPLIAVDKDTDLQELSEMYLKADPEVRPSLVLFYESKNREQRILRFQGSFPIKFKKQIEPGRLDIILHNLNPKNRIERVHVYEILWDEMNLSKP